MAKQSRPDSPTLWNPEEEVALHKGLPSNAYAEKLVLGSCLVNSRRYLPLVRSILRADDFMTEANRTVYQTMIGLDERGEYVDRVTVANSLNGADKLDKIGGLAYLVSLDDDMPEIVNLESYIGIIRDKSILRQVIKHTSAIQQEAFRAEKPPAEILSELEDRILGVYKDNKSEEMAESFEDLVMSYGGIDQYFRRDFSNAIQSPWVDLNALLGYMQPGQLITVAARPACGKTVVGLQIAARAARSVETTYYTLEETRRGLYDRLISAYAAVPAERIQLGETALTLEDKHRIAKAAGEISTLKLRINDRSAASIYSLRSHLMKAKARKKPARVVVIDYLQLMRGGGRDKRHDEVSEITRGLKLLAEEFQVIIVMLSQLNREVEKRPGGKPQLSDLRESGTIEQDSDKVILLWRPELYSQDPSLMGLFTILVAKNRQGRVGEVNLIFQGEYQRVMNPRSIIESAPVFADDPPVRQEPVQRLMGEEAA